MATSYDTTFRVVSLIIVFSTLFCAYFFSGVICSRVDILCIFITAIGTYFLCLTTTLHVKRLILICVTVLLHSGEEFDSRAIFNFKQTFFMCINSNLLIE